MARASTIHIVRESNTILGAYTVKYECLDALLDQVVDGGLGSVENAVVIRVPDGDWASDRDRVMSVFTFFKENLKGVRGYLNLPGYYSQATKDSYKCAVSAILQRLEVQ